MTIYPLRERAAVQKKMSKEFPVGWMTVPSGSSRAQVSVPVNGVTKQVQSAARWHGEVAQLVGQEV